MALQDLKIISISIFLSLLLPKIVASDVSGIGSCITSYNRTVNNQTGLIDTSYQITLQALFSNLTSSSLSFYASTAGESPNKAYALYICRGDVSSGDCNTCVKSITDRIPTIYDSCKEGVLFGNDCFLHFANYSFFGIFSTNQALGFVPGKFSATNYVEYNKTLVAVLKEVIADANNSTTLFAKREVKVEGDGEEKVYALAQCTRDLDRGNCSGCLNAAFVTLTNYTSTEAGVAKSDNALLASCWLRYDNVTFNGASPVSVSAFLVATWSLFFIHLSI